MCADGKRDMPFSLSTMVAVGVTMVATVMIAAMEMGNISQKPALTVVMSVDVSIDTEIISDLELYTYLTDHPDHSKFNIRETIRHRVLEPIRYRHRDVENIRMKTGVYRGRGGHPPETLTAPGYHAFGIYGPSHGHHGQLTALCPLDPPSETASITPVSIPGNVRLEHSRPGLTKTGHCRVRGALGESMGQMAAGILSESEIVREGKGVPEARSAESERSLLSSNHGT